MAIEETIQKRIESLLKVSSDLSVGNEYDQCTDGERHAECCAWIAAAHNIVHLIISDPESPYRKSIDKIAEKHHGYQINVSVRNISSILASLLKDADQGLISSIGDQARAEIFDDFLDHAEHYLDDDKKNESGVIAGVVFEDTIRKISSKLKMPEKGVKLDSLISELVKKSVFTPVKAKRARAAADVRTKATHAQWTEFEKADVRSTIDLTRELIETILT